MSMYYANNLNYTILPEKFEFKFFQIRTNWKGGGIKTNEFIYSKTFLLLTKLILNYSKYNLMTEYV